MIAGMDPVRLSGVVRFCTLTDRQVVAAALPHARAMVREEEGITLILPVDHPAALGSDSPSMIQITLQVQSALDGVGLTAAVADALAQVGIPCNVIAGHHHDHIFVPEDRADMAVAALRARAAS
nr:ACT domain-containing protein [Actibacterium sp. 188UL27-1]